MVLLGEVPDVLVPFAPQRFTRALVRKNPTRRDLAADAA
jgi:D-amino-acid dehydrogenase